LEARQQIIERSLERHSRVGIDKQDRIESGFGDWGLQLP